MRGGPRGAGEKPGPESLSAGVSEPWVVGLRSTETRPLFAYSFTWFVPPYIPVGTELTWSLRWCGVSVHFLGVFSPWSCLAGLRGPAHLWGGSRGGRAEEQASDAPRPARRGPPRARAQPARPQWEERSLRFGSAAREKDCMFFCHPCHLGHWLAQSSKAVPSSDRRQLSDLAGDS